MIFFLLFLFIIILYKSKLNFKSFNLDYISIDQTKCINAIFVVIVFLSHVKAYVYLENVWFNSYYLKINTLIGQLMVTTFLFFSGFGIMESIKKKNKAYISSIPKKRILKTLINFDIAVLLFLICNLIIKNNYEIKTILISFTGWSAIGNSNWYIFDILILYMITWISFSIFKNNNLRGLVLTTLLSIILIYFLKIFKESHWYNTILCYPAGMLFSYYKTNIEKLIFKNNIIYVMILIACTSLFIVLYKLGKYNLFIYELVAILFVFIILLICMKFQFKNKILTYLGNNIFWIYILQRIPMIMLKHYNVDKYSSFAFIIFSFVLTLFITEIIKILLKFTSTGYLKLKNIIIEKRA